MLRTPVETVHSWGARRAPSLLHPAGATRSPGRVPRTPRGRVAGDAGRAEGGRLARLLALPARRRPARRVLPHGRPGRVAGGDGAHRRQRPLAGRDGTVLRGTGGTPAGRG